MKPIEFCPSIKEAMRFMLHEDSDSQHALHVALLSDALFHLTTPLHGYTLHGPEHSLLICAALLHDIGWKYSDESGRGHHKKSADWIRSHSWKSWHASSIPIIAAIARYHRKALPCESHADMQLVKKTSHKLVSKMAALLRICDALDYSHLQHVQISTVKSTITHTNILISTPTTSSIDSEVKSVDKKKNLFEKVYQQSVSLTWAT